MEKKDWMAFLTTKLLLARREQEQIGENEGYEVFKVYEKPDLPSSQIGTVMFEYESTDGEGDETIHRPSWKKHTRVLIFTPEGNREYRWYKGTSVKEAFDATPKDENFRKKVFHWKPSTAKEAVLVALRKYRNDDNECLVAMGEGVLGRKGVEKTSNVSA